MASVISSLLTTTSVTVSSDSSANEFASFSGAGVCSTSTLSSAGADSSTGKSELTSTWHFRQYYR